MAVCPTATPTSCSSRSSSLEQTGTGFGLGLAISRWGAEANSGRIRTRARPARAYYGCIFIVDLPRAFSLPDASVNQGVAQAG